MTTLLITLLLAASAALAQDVATPTTPADATVAHTIKLSPELWALSPPMGVEPIWEGDVGEVPPLGTVCPVGTVPAVTGTPDSGPTWGNMEQVELDRNRAAIAMPEGEEDWYRTTAQLNGKPAVWCIPRPPRPEKGDKGEMGGVGPAGPKGEDGRDMMFTLALTGGGSFIKNPATSGTALLPVGFGRLEGGLLLPLNGGDAAIGPFVAGSAGGGGQYAGEVGGRFVAFPGKLAALSLSAGYFHEKTGWDNALYDYALNGVVGGVGLALTPPSFNGKPVGASIVLAADGLVYEAGDATAAEAPRGIGGRVHGGVSLSF